jgi:hypothetical protein
MSIIRRSSSLMFCAVTGFQDIFPKAGSQIVGVLDNAGVANALVATLKHQSPYCVAAAAGGLILLGRIPGGGQGLVEAAGAIPALVRVIGKAHPPGDPAKDTGIYQRCAGKHESPPFAAI